MTRMKVWCLTIRIKRNDELHGKRLQNLLIDFLMGARFLVPPYGMALMDLVNVEGRPLSLKEYPSTCL